MTRRGLYAAVLGTFVFSLVMPSALAGHCEPIDNPDPIPGQNTDYCHEPPETQPPKTPKPATPKPTTAPATAAPAPTRAPGPAAPVRPPSTVSTPNPTADDIEVPEEDPLATPEIIVDGPIDGGEEFNVQAEESASASSWIFGFFVGLIVGALAGRASWGIRRRRRQQIFG